MSPIEQIPDLDLYRELEVDPAASTATIDAAYRSLMKRHHPDLAGQLGVKRSKRLNLAHEWLTDPERRRRYDAATEQTDHPGPGSGPRDPAGCRDPFVARGVVRLVHHRQRGLQVRRRQDRVPMAGTPPRHKYGGRR